MMNGERNELKVVSLFRDDQKKAKNEVWRISIGVIIHTLHTFLGIIHDCITRQYIEFELS